MLQQSAPLRTCACCDPRKTFLTLTSKAPKGPSNNKTLGSTTRARAKATLRHCPLRPDDGAGYMLQQPAPLCTCACCDPLRLDDGAGHMLQQPAHICACTAAAAGPGSAAARSTLQALVARHGGVRCREAGPPYCLENAPVS